MGRDPSAARRTGSDYPAADPGGARGPGTRGSAGGDGSGASSSGRAATRALQSPDRRLRRASSRPHQPASGSNRQQWQRVASRGGGAHAAGPSGRQGGSQRALAPAGNARDHFDPSRDPLAGPLDTRRLEPLSRHDRAHPLPSAIRQLDLRGPGDWPITARVLQNQSPGLREGQSLTLSVSPEFVTLLQGKFAVGNTQ